MDTILEKLGIYDLIVLLFTGMIILLISLKILPDFDLKVTADDTMEFLIIGYFIGMIFQEIGSAINNKLIAKRMLKKVFDGQHHDYHFSLSQKEVNFIKNTISNRLNDETTNFSIEEIYHYCKSEYLKLSSGTIEIDKQHSIGGMARSLFIYFLIITLIFIKEFICSFDIKCIGLAVVSSLCAYIFFNRYVRFYKMRYVHILRSFYYRNLS